VTAKDNVNIPDCLSFGVANAPFACQRWSLPRPDYHVL